VIGPSHGRSLGRFVFAQLHSSKEFYMSRIGGYQGPWKIIWAAVVVSTIITLVTGEVWHWIAVLAAASALYWFRV